jgi:hypothetical protein
VIEHVCENKKEHTLKHIILLRELCVTRFATAAPYGGQSRHILDETNFKAFHVACGSIHCTFRIMSSETLLKTLRNKLFSTDSITFS